MRMNNNNNNNKLRTFSVHYERASFGRSKFGENGDITVDTGGKRTRKQSHNKNNNKNKKRDRKKNRGVQYMYSYMTVATAIYVQLYDSKPLQYMYSYMTVSHCNICTAI